MKENNRSLLFLLDDVQSNRWINGPDMHAKRSDAKACVIEGMEFIPGQQAPNRLLLLSKFSSHGVHKIIQQGPAGNKPISFFLFLEPCCGPNQNLIQKNSPGKRSGFFSICIFKCCSKTILNNLCKKFTLFV